MILSSFGLAPAAFGLAPAAFAQLAPNGSTGSPSPSPTGSRHRFESDAERFNRRHRS